MKIRNVFALFLMCSIFISAIGVFPAGAHTTASPMLEKGPQAILANVTNPASPSYGLFTCQVGLSSHVCYDPYQIRAAYSIDKLINAGFTGRGKTIVIIDAYQSPNIVNELNTFNDFYSLPGLNGLGGKFDPKLGRFTQIAPDGLTPFDETDGNMLGWAEEITLDVLWAHAIAPGANITLVLAKSYEDADILSATKFAVDRKLGDVISQSFGEDERCMDPKLLVKEHQVFADATRKNITLFASSGDDGAAQPTCDGSSYSKAASSPASDPLVTGVGGTELHAAGYCLTSLGCDPTANPAPGTYQGEIVWNEFDSSIATGGGFSVLYDEPAYQKWTILGKQRGVPDVSYSAAVYHGVLTYLDVPGDYTGWVLFGGTSAGSPQWAAILAIADQKVGHDLGFINTALYKISLVKKNYAASFFDVISGNNSVDEQDSAGNDVPVQGFNAKKGWDAATGLGSPVTDQLVSLLKKLVLPGDGKAAILDSMPHPKGMPFWPGHMWFH